MGSQIKYLSHFLPDRVLSNNDLQQSFGKRDVAKMANRIGVYNRRIAAEDETALDLAHAACIKLFTKYKYDRKKIDFIILCTQSPDYYLPTSACLLQERLGLSKNVGAFDINQGCSGFIYAMATAKGFIEANVANHVLLVMAETYSKHINEEDLGNRLIFGDAASAILIERKENGKIGDFVLGTNGEGAKNLIVPNGGMRCRFDPKAEREVDKRNDVRTRNDLYMNGSEIFYFVGKEIPEVIKETLRRNEMKEEDIDYYIFHQANRYMIDFLAKKLKLNKDRYYNNIEDIGNTVSCTIPIALEQCLEKRLTRKGDKILLCGFGVGYSWGAVIIEV